MPFSRKFLFGAFVGAHQAEGGDYASDWWRWEQRPTRIRDGETSAVGAGHWERGLEDVALAHKLGHNALCLSLSWPRIQPAMDRFDSNVLAHYREVFEQAADLGMHVVCVLQHFTVPAWFSDLGGWENAQAPGLFHDYVREVVAALGTGCFRWVPLYEPEFWLAQVCRERRWPGARSRLRTYGRLHENLLRAQVGGASAIRECLPHAEVGLSIRGIPVEPWDPHSPWDERAAHFEQQRLNMRFPTGVIARGGEGSFDFIALSYYGNLRVRFAPTRIMEGFALPVDRNGRSIGIGDAAVSPAGFEEILSTVASFNKPILITGLGIATDRDIERCRFLRDHVSRLLYAMDTMEAGIEVKALFYMSLLDSFEWHDGYSKRFGLVHVKRPGLERTPNNSAWFFKDIADHGCIRPGISQQFCGE